MKKRYWIPPLLLFGASALVYLNLAQGREVLDQFNTLAASGQEEAKACAAFKAKAERISWSDVNAQEPPRHASKEEALSALALMEEYPGAPPANLKAAKLFREHHQQLSSRLDQVSILAKWGSLEQDCDLFFAYKHARALLYDIRALGLAPSDAARAREAVKRYLKRQSPPETLIGVMMRGSIYQEFFKAEGRRELADAAAKFNDRAESMRQAMQESNRELSRWRIFTISGLDTELDLIGNLGREYLALLEEAKI